MRGRIQFLIDTLPPILLLQNIHFSSPVFSLISVFFPLLPPFVSPLSHLQPSLKKGFLSAPLHIAEERIKLLSKKKTSFAVRK